MRIGRLSAGLHGSVAVGISRTLNVDQSHAPWELQREYLTSRRENKMEMPPLEPPAGAVHAQLQSRDRHDSPGLSGVTASVTSHCQDQVCMYGTSASTRCSMTSNS